MVKRKTIPALPPPVYFSTDLEFDGPRPQDHSMLSIGAVAYNEHGEELGRFYRNLQPLPGHAQDPDTMQNFWRKKEHQASWAATQIDPLPPQQAMAEYVQWVQGLGGHTTLLAEPMEIEERWLNFYLDRFGIDWPFAAMQEISPMLRQAESLLAPGESLPDALMSDHPYTHHALDDAIFQGETFCRIKAWIAARLLAREPAGYTAYTLDNATRDALLQTFPPTYPVVKAHHVTEKFGAAPGDLPATPGRMEIIGIADDGRGCQALILSVDGKRTRADGNPYHITWSIDDRKIAPAEFHDVPPGQRKAMAYQSMHSNRMIATGRHNYYLDAPIPLSATPEYIALGPAQESLSR